MVRLRLAFRVGRLTTKKGRWTTMTMDDDGQMAQPPFDKSGLTGRYPTPTNPHPSFLKVADLQPLSSNKLASTSIDTLTNGE